MPVKYDDPAVEPAIENEKELTQEIISLINRIQDHNFSMHRHGFRGTHVKVQGIVKGYLIVPKLPDELAHGICAKPAAYDVALRYANEPSFLQDDRTPGPRGCAMRIFSEPVQDLTFNNAPILELRDMPTTVEIFRIRERHFREPEKIADELKQRTDKDLQMAPTQLPNKHFLSYTMYSQSAYRWGPYVVKYALFPTANVPETNVDQSSDPEQHSKWLKDYFADNEMTYDLRIQLCEDVEKQSVEDASVEWNEEQFPFRTVGKVVLPKQDSFNPTRRSFWDDRMKLNVWAGSDQHRPLGSVNRLRKNLYEESQKKRADLNDAELLRVTTIEQMP